MVLKIFKIYKSFFNFLSKNNNHVLNELKPTQFSKLNLSFLRLYSTTNYQHFSLNNLNNDKIKNILKNFNFKEEEIEKVSNSSNLSSISQEELILIIKTLKKFLFITPQIVKLFSFHHNLISDSSFLSNTQNLLSEIRSFGLEEKKSQHILSQNPYIYLTPLKEIKKNYKIISNYFVNSDSRLIIYKCPNVLTDDEDISNYKINYALQKLNLDTRTIARTKYLSYSIEKIITRHRLLERLGMYKKIKNNNNNSLYQNPLLKDIYDSSDFKFVKFVSKITFEEYNVFCKMIKSEINNEIENNQLEINNNNNDNKYNSYLEEEEEEEEEDEEEEEYEEEEIEKRKIK